MHIHGEFAGAADQLADLLGRTGQGLATATQPVYQALYTYDQGRWDAAASSQGRRVRLGCGHLAYKCNISISRRIHTKVKRSPCNRQHTGLVNLTATEQWLVFSSKSYVVQRWKSPNFHRAVYLSVDSNK